nr:hypothetical protein BaRGS_025739 [Batillaria attramentaria]
MADEEEKENFYEQLQAVLDKAPRRDLRSSWETSTPKVGTDNTDRELIMGKHGTGTQNENGELFTEFCTTNDLRGNALKDLINHTDDQDDKRDLQAQYWDVNRQTEIIKAIKSLKSGKAAGPDGIPPEALKADIQTSTDMLHPLLRKIWESESVPQDWKKGHLTGLKINISKTEVMRVNHKQHDPIQLHQEDIKEVDKFIYLGSVYPLVITNQDLWERTRQVPIEQEIKKRKWGWIGTHFAKANINVTRQSLDWNPQGKRKVGRPKQTWRRKFECLKLRGKQSTVRFLLIDLDTGGLFHGTYPETTKETNKRLGPRKTTTNNGNNNNNNNDNNNDNDNHNHNDNNNYYYSNYNYNNNDNNNYYHSNCNYNKTIT